MPLQNITFVHQGRSFVALEALRICVLGSQLNNFAVPTSLEGLSLGTILLATLGNGLMVPRALFTRDSIWLLGSAWGSVFGWLQLLSMFVGRTASGCVPTAPLLCQCVVVL